MQLAQMFSHQLILLSCWSTVITRLRRLSPLLLMTAQLALTMQQEADRLGLLSPRAKKVGRGNSCAAYAPLPKIDSCCSVQCKHMLTICIDLLYTCIGDDMITNVVLV